VKDPRPSDLNDPSKTSAGDAVFFDLIHVRRRDALNQLMSIQAVIRLL
jgi:hypothetical protein